MAASVNKVLFERLLKDKVNNFGKKIIPLEILSMETRKETVLLY